MSSSDCTTFDCFALVSCNIFIVLYATLGVWMFHSGKQHGIGFPLIQVLVIGGLYNFSQYISRHTSRVSKRYVSMCMSTIRVICAMVRFVVVRYYRICSHASKALLRICRAGNNWVWRRTRAGDVESLVASPGPTVTNLPFARNGMAARSWAIINETHAACRAQLGLDRFSSHSDPATRQLVKKTCFGILTDSVRFPSLRRTDAERLCAIASEMALTPITEEIEGLNVASSAPMVRNRSLARGAWERYPTSWFQWLLIVLRIRSRQVYLPAVPNPSF